MDKEMQVITYENETYYLNLKDKIIEDTHGNRIRFYSDITDMQTVGGLAYRLFNSLQESVNAFDYNISL